MVTGGTGYIGSWVVKDLLEKGYTVRLTVRNKTKIAGDDHLTKIAENTSGTLEIWEANLMKDGSFNEAAKGSDAIIHVASPFTLKVKDAQKELIDPALEGTRNVLAAASLSESVKRIVLTSSVAAVYGDNRDMSDSGLSEFTEEHFNYSSSLSHQPYSYSKLVAEKAAWEMHGLQDQWKLVVINPSFVMGPSLTQNSNSESLSFMNDMISGKFRMGVPHLEFSFVDVRDVAKAHVLALENENTEGRHILAVQTLGVLQVAQLIKNKFGNKYKLPTMQIPKFVLYLIGWMFGLNAKFINRNVGYSVNLNTSKSRNQLGLKYTKLAKTLEDMVLQMEEVKIKLKD